MKLSKPVAIVALAWLGLVATAQAAVDPALPQYQKANGISGNLSSIGSDTLANMLTLWAEAFKRIYPNVNVQVQAAGSSTAPPALIEGTAQLGPMSRKMKEGEIDAFEKRYGYKPVAIPVAIDALAVFVHKDNPIKGLTMQQLDDIFSSTLRCGGTKPIRSWGELGLGNSWARADLQLFGRNSVSGTYGYFKEHVLCRGDFRNTVNEQPGSASVVQAISASLNSIGYSGIGYVTSGVRALPLSVDGKTYIDPSEANAVNGRYPLSRYLFIYVNKRPNQPLEPMTLEFIKLVLSQQGQRIVERDGYVPLPASVVNRHLAMLSQ